MLFCDSTLLLVPCGIETQMAREMPSLAMGLLLVPCGIETSDI